MLKFLLKLFKDEKGTVWWQDALISAGSTALAESMKGEDEYKRLEPYSDYESMMSNVARQIGQRVGQPGAQYTGSFNIPQPGIEAQTERILGEKLGNLPSAASYKQQVEASKTQQIAREKERAGEQKTEEEGMYNRLGLVSSTPWMARAGELGEESLGRQKDIETGMDVYGLEYGLQADELANRIANQYLSQGQILGQAQRGYGQYPLQMNYDDWVRSQNEPYKWAGLASGMKQEPVYQEPEIGMGQMLTESTIKALPYLLMLLGGA